VLTLAFGGLRFGEATALRRCDVRTDDSMIAVERSVRHLDGRWVIGPPKTDAGRRTVALPGFVAAAVADHLDTHVTATTPSFSAPGQADSWPDRTSR
jgi:integrase